MIFTYFVEKRKLILPCTIKSTFSNPLCRYFPEAKIDSSSTATLALLLLVLQLAKKAFYITTTTLSLCHSWPEHEVRLSRSCDGLCVLLCYKTDYFIRSCVNKVHELACGPSLPRNYTPQQNHNTLGKNQCKL